MLFGQMKNQVMHQTGNDLDDLGEFMPYLAGYLNEGYDRLVYAYSGAHAGSKEYPWLENDGAEPKLPEWCHAAIADWATWLVYRNGNPSKQNRGSVFRSSFAETESRVLALTAAQKGIPGSAKLKFTNIP